ncbi:Phox/Bem1p [Macleaya cordata]|uniref:Phox/Bem1p n=1 Tax=Macleaya cordata TaxID=56857 RepID=A0A200Q4Z9_MACCD|nr:Phox/Bem1p [Macleaya cordata]
MESKSGKGLMEQSKSYEQLRYAVEARNEGLDSASQRHVQDPSSSINTNMRPPDFNIPGGAKPVLNYSIQTGEEFALEFMRERVNSRKPMIPHAASDPSNMTGYMDLKGILGISHTGSESGSDISMLSTVERVPFKEFERKVSGNDSRYDSMRSAPRTFSRNGSSQGVHHGYASSGASDSSSARIKFLCSFGGKILPRPSDGKLRYVGGETRIIRISKDISWQELMQKTTSVYNQAHAIKYQLPGEDLDALVSVSCDEDLQNMMEECNFLEDGGKSQKPRMFLVSANDMDDPHFGLGSMEGDSEIQYVVAVNGMDLGPRKNSSGLLASTSGNDLDQLLSLNTEMETTRVAAGLTHASSAPLAGSQVPPSTNQSSQPMVTSSSSAYETHTQSYQGQVLHNIEAERYPFSAVHLDGRISVPSTVPLQYGENPHSANYAPFGVSVPVLSHGRLTQQGGFTEGHAYGFQMQDSELLVNESKPYDGKPDQTQSVENEYLASSKPYDGSSLHNFQKDGPSLATSEAERGAPFLASKESTKQQKIVHNSVLPDAGKAYQPNDEDDCHTSGGAFTLGYADSEADSTDFSYHEPPVLPPRVFHSERIPYKLAEPELHNRLSKSDDSFGSQFLISQTRSGLVQQEAITESVDKPHEGNLSSQTEVSISSTKPLHANSPTVEEGLMQFEKYKELADTISQMSQLDPRSQTQKSELKHAVPTQLDDKDSLNEDRVKNSHKEISTDGTEAAGSDYPSAANINNAVGSTQPFAWTGGPSARTVSQAGPSVTVNTKEHGDILIDINDRFPRDFLSDIFSKARNAEDSTGISPYYKDGAGLSLDMENHEPKHWSFFQKLAQNEFDRKDVSLMDQDHLGFSSPLTNVKEELPGAYNFSPLKPDGVALGPVNSQISFDEEIQQESSNTIGADTIGLRPDYNPSQVRETENLQFDAMSFSKAGDSPGIPESETEDGKLENGDFGVSLFGSSLGDFDISTLQLIKNEDLEELRELGSGTFGTVYHGKWRGTDVAIKRIKKSCFTGRSSEQERLTVEFWREADILSKLHHPNVVAFYGVVQDGPGGTMATVTEYMVNGSLRHVLVRQDRNLDRRKRLIIAMDAAFGMEYLHSKNIVHFDLKCDNLLVNLKDPLRPICKVGDFGLSKIKRNTLVTGGVRGTLPWMAPELLNGSSSKVSEKVDVFSFGIVLWEILTGEEPYANMHYGAIIGGIVSNTLRPPVPSFCDSEWRNLMEECWAPDPVARPSFTEIASRLRVMSAAAAQTRPHQAAK